MHTSMGATMNERAAKRMAFRIHQAPTKEKEATEETKHRGGGTSKKRELCRSGQMVKNESSCAILRSMERIGIT